MRTLWSSAKHFWQIHLTVALCTAVATGVLAGALIVGDSMRGSLQDITLERLGNIEQVLISDRFFSPEIFSQADKVSAILINGSVVVPQTENRASKVNIYGVEKSFFEFWDNGVIPNWHRSSDQPFGDIVINQTLQKELNVNVGDTVFVSFQQAAEIHPEFLLGTRDATDVIQRLRLIVSDIIPAENAGRFSLQPHQSLPLNAYVSLPVIQKELGQLGKVNAVFSTDTNSIIPESLTITLATLGLQINVYEEYFDLQSDQYLLEPVLSETALSVAAENNIPVLPSLTYLANTISVDSQMEDNNEQRTNTIPYSTMLALPFEDSVFSAVINKINSEEQTGNLTEVILNTWAAEDLGAKVGDQINITYFSVKADEEYETESASFVLSGIVPIEGFAADRNIIPVFPGIHDTATIADWEPPFPFDYSLIRDKDDVYWEQYKATPKAFISLDIGKQLWQNRFGDLTTIRMNAAPEYNLQDTRALFETAFLKKINPEQIGFQFLSPKVDGLNASVGSTDFGMLFGSLSGFIIMAVALLVGMLFRIGVEQRSREIGILQAVGYPLRKIRRSFLAEGIIVASIGGLFGCFLAIGYGQLMVYGLKTWWLPAIGTPFVNLHVNVLSLLLGAVISLIVVIVSIYMTVRKLGHLSTVSLILGETDFDEKIDKTPKGKAKEIRFRNKAAILVVVILGTGFGFIAGMIADFELTEFGWSDVVFLVVSTAVILFIFHYYYRRGTKLSGTAYQMKVQLRGLKLLTLFLCIGTFIGFIISGLPFSQIVSDKFDGGLEHPVTKFLMLTVGVLSLGWTIFANWLKSQKVSEKLNRLRFALKNAARQPSRSKTCVITISLACFIIVAVGANRHDSIPYTQYSFVAESSLPLLHNLSTAEGRSELGFDEKDEVILSISTVYPFRVLPGEDVSCLNLYKPEKPQILGAPDKFSADMPWLAGKVLDRDEGSIPGIGDEKSLRWILHHDPNEVLIIQDEFGNPVKLLLDTVNNSLFQSQLIISEDNFTKYFPSQSGYQYFLIKTPVEFQESTSSILETTLSDYGFDVTLAADRLASFRAVENTYISTFQSLGGLGVLLGTFGLALVLLRNIIERRGELATLRAFGFRRQVLLRMLFLESIFLLTVGMFIGVVSGVVSILGFGAHLNSLPWFSLSITLLFIFSFGIIANAIVVSLALRSPLLATLKSE